MKPARMSTYAVAVTVAGLVFVATTSGRDGGNETAVWIEAGASSSTAPAPGVAAPPVPAQPETTAAVEAETPPSTSFPVGDSPTDAASDEIVDEPGDPDAPGAPALPVPVEKAPVDGPSTGNMPEVNPVVITGAETTFYLPSNSAQATMLGLQPGQVRTWGMTFEPSGDHDLDHQRIVDGLTASGVDVQADLLAGSAEGSGMLGGAWGDYTVNVIVGNWTSITVNLIDGL